MNTFTITDAHKEELYKISLNHYQNLSRLRLNNGHKLFKIDVESGKLNTAIYTNIGSKVVVTPELGQIYIGALNEKNALKKFIKVLQYVNTVVEHNKSAHLTLEGDHKIINAKSNNTQ